MENNKIVLSGIFSEGYGIIPKKLMKAQDIKSTTKLILCYLLSYTGAGVTCFPQIKNICADLSISKSTFLRCISEAIDNDYLQKHQENRGQHIGKKNIYELLFMYEYAGVNLARAKMELLQVSPVYSNNNIYNNNNNNKNIDFHNIKYKIPLLSNNFFFITDEIIQKYKNVYSAVNIENELKKIIQWFYDNSEKKRTQKNIAAFLNNWFLKKQDMIEHDKKYIKNIKQLKYFFCEKCNTEIYHFIDKKNNYRCNVCNNVYKNKDME